jgi:sugar/nucleoside kinase (ribokinase family)
LTRLFFPTVNKQNNLAKCGVRGALVIEPGRYPSGVPAYHSERVFKIGTGDIFSAAFAYYWMEKGLAPRDAADRASHTVASYTEAPTSSLQARDTGTLQKALSSKKETRVIERVDQEKLRREVSIGSQFRKVANELVTIEIGGTQR